MTTGNTTHYFFLLGGICENVDFANFLVVEGCLGCIGMNFL